MINKHEQLVKIMLNSKSENTFFFIYITQVLLI